ncbi:MAG: hypothetical protein ACKV19_08290 [Verrucomicrobiales bacterium]
MSRGRRLSFLLPPVLAAVFGVLLAVSVRADGPPVPPAPADGLYDDTSVLSDVQRAAAVKAVASARAAGVDLHVALYSYIVGETIERRAERLKEVWCPNGSGLLVVADTSTNQCTYLSHVADTEWLSTTELQRIFTEASAVAAASDGTSADKVLVVIENLAPRLRDAMEKHRALTRYRVSPRAWWIFGAVTASILALSAFALLARWLFHRHRQATTTVPLYFPTVTVGERFGGSFGGGVIAEVHFGANDNE